MLITAVTTHKLFSNLILVPLYFSTFTFRTNWKLETGSFSSAIREVIRDRRDDNYIKDVTSLSQPLFSRGNPNYNINVRLSSRLTQQGVADEGWRISKAQQQTIHSLAIFKDVKNRSLFPRPPLVYITALLSPYCVSCIDQPGAAAPIFKHTAPLESIGQWYRENRTHDLDFLACCIISLDVGDKIDQVSSYSGGREGGGEREGERQR